MLKTIAIGAAFAVLAAITPAAAQQLPSMTTQAPTIKRTPLQKIDVPEGSRETVMALAEIVPNVLICKHTHPGPEVSYLLEGELTLMVQGQPDKTYKVGDTSPFRAALRTMRAPARTAPRCWRPISSRRASRSPHRRRRVVVPAWSPRVRPSVGPRMNSATCGTVSRMSLARGEPRARLIRATGHAASLLCCRNISSARRWSSCGSTSSLWVAMCQVLPAKSRTEPVRSP